MDTNNPIVFSVKKEDFEFQWFSGTGAGGQYRNKHQNCFRLKHRATGIIKTGQSHRDRRANRREALVAMRDDPRFRAYCAARLRAIEEGKTLEDVQIRQDNRWVDVDEIPETSHDADV